MRKLSFISIVGLAALVAAVIGLQSPRPPVVVREVGSGGHNRIHLSVSAATSRNDQALRLCETEVNTILGREFQEIERRANLAAERISAYGSCCTIIYRLAKEQLWSSGPAGHAFNEQSGIEKSRRSGLTFGSPRKEDLGRAVAVAGDVDGMVLGAIATPFTYGEARFSKLSEHPTPDGNTAATAPSTPPRTWRDFAYDPAATTASSVNWAACQTARGALNVDGAAAAGVGIPSGYVAASTVGGDATPEGSTQAGAGTSPPGGFTAAAYVEGEMMAEMQPAIDACASELNLALDRYERALRTSTATLAYELAQAGVGSSGKPVDVHVDMQSKGELDTALGNLGFRGASIVVASIFDIPALLNNRILSGMLAKAVQLTATMFAKPAAAAAGSAVIAAADGPAPIGDALAIVGGLWTAYEVYSIRADFEKEIKASIANTLPRVKRDVHHQIMDRVHTLQSAYQQVQDEIRSQATTKLVR